MSDVTRLIELTVTEEHFPRYDPAHGTPDPMVRRLLSITTPKGRAQFEQTDYGHPGKLHPWDPRGIDAALQPRTEELRALAAAAGALLDQ